MIGSAAGHCGASQRRGGLPREEGQFGFGRSELLPSLICIEAPADENDDQVIFGDEEREAR
jgi:hypothetical protein